MDARGIIIALREGRGLPAEAAHWFARGLADGAVEDAQAGAFAMAVLLKGLDRADRVALTEAMRDSGDVLRWDLPGPVVDKHSTGGVGDSTSLIIAPALAACGAYVPMISGRGLGHTGGTLDKMESIPGYNALPDNDKLRQVVAGCGCAIVGATDRIAPADRRLYAIRDIAGAVESIDLITASILSKKLAAGLDALILDVKCGSGAFMRRLEDARALANSLVETANGAGCKTAALITDMNSPLGRSAGNSCEVYDCIEVLTSRQGFLRHGPLAKVSVALAAEGLMLAGLAETEAEARDKITEAIASGRAAERFARMVAALGGPHDLIENPGKYLERGGDEYWEEMPSDAGPWIASVDVRALGDLVVQMGGGRLKQGDRINHSVGLYGLARVGDEVKTHRYTGSAFGVDDAMGERAAKALNSAYTMSHDKVEPAPLILEKVGA